MQEDWQRSPTGATPPWADDEARVMAASLVRSPARSPSPTRRGSWGWWAVAAVLVASAAVVAVLANGAGVFAPGRPAAWPAAPTQVAPSPLGSPSPLAATSGAYAFLETQRGSADPVAWDPCRAVHYVVRPQGQPDGGAELLAQALADVSAATGLMFVEDGPTDEAPAGRRALVSHELYGDRWAPVLIAWETAGENPDLAGDAIAEAEPFAVTRPSDGLRLFVSGQVRLDQTQIADLLVLPGGHDRASLTLIHELGHLVGLDHVDDPTQVMYPELMPGITGYSAGDLSGLAMLGQGRCAPDV